MIQGLCLFIIIIIIYKKKQGNCLIPIYILNPVAVNIVTVEPWRRPLLVAADRLVHKLVYICAHIVKLWQW